MDHIQVSTAVALIVGYFAAHASALFVHFHAPDWFQGAVTTALTVAAGVFPTVAFNASDNWKTYVFNVVSALLTAFFAYQTKIPAAVQLKVKAGLGKNLQGVRARHATHAQAVAA